MGNSKPKGYLLVNIDIHDMAAFEDYRSRSVPYVQSRGGKYLVASGDFDHREGKLDLARLVIIEFPSLAEAKAAYDDPHYRSEILPHRLRAANNQLLIVEGRD